jgi:hypothetical protein
MTTDISDGGSFWANASAGRCTRECSDDRPETS